MSNITRVIVAFALLTLSIVGCDPVPGHELSASEKRADMEWLFTKFDHNYAPLQYKVDLHKFDYQKIKAEYLELALATKSNEAFYQVALEFVSRFKDAHTSARLTPSNLPGRVKIAYLGFSGVRMGESLLVESLLPTIKEGSSYPIRVGDVITAVNGMSIRDYVNKHMVKVRDLGSEESNLTMHANGIFNRTSISHEMPADSMVTLSVFREDGAKTFNVKMPWIVKDLYEFQLEQKSVKEIALGRLSDLQITEAGNTFSLSLVDIEGQPVKFGSLRRMLRHMYGGRRFLSSFNMIPHIAGWKVSKPKKDKKSQSPLEMLAETRYVPEFVTPIAQATAFPSYVTAVETASGARKLVGYIRIGTFSPMLREETVIEELKATVATFQNQGVKDIVIDLLNNGGGSLSLVLKVAQLFSNKKIENFGMQFSLNENWLSDLQSASLFGNNDAEKELQRRLYEDLRKQQLAGRRLSDTYPIESLLPYSLEPNEDLTTPFNIVLLTNEMCASAADMFSSLMKHNKLATLVGKQTMGAGGNVVQHWKSPNASFTLNQTESLLINPDGTVLENNGVKPHVELETSLFVREKYETLIEAAFSLAVELAEGKNISKPKRRRSKPEIQPAADVTSSANRFLANRCSSLIVN